MTDKLNGIHGVFVAHIVGSQCYNIPSIIWFLYDSKIQQLCQNLASLNNSK